MCDVRENLKEIIVSSGYKQTVIAQKAQLTAAKLSAILNKTRKLDANEMFTLCDVLGITPEQLFNHKKSI